MEPARILLKGFLALAAVLVVTVAIQAVAPYLALIIVISGICWFYLQKPEKPSQTEITPKE